MSSSIIIDELYVHQTQHNSFWRSMEQGGPGLGGRFPAGFGVAAIPFI
jgi:hypothetical protein